MRDDPPVRQPASRRRAKGADGTDAAAASGTKARVTTAHERQFYGLDRAIGRFGMRIFTPHLMEAPHWHGHVEANFITGATMTYDVDGDRIEVAPGRLAMFWAGIPHQLLEVTPVAGQADGADPVRLANIYLPLDMFLFMPHIAHLQVALLGGALVQFTPDLCSEETIARWYRDYRSNDVERMEVMKMELNAMLRRALTGEVDYLRAPMNEVGSGRQLSSVHIRHVIAMVRFILENLGAPITNTDVATVTGLHRNYALSLFTGTMRLPMKRFIIRMRLLRARAHLMESSVAISTVAEMSGFQSISQFYAHFKASYGISPHALRESYMRSDPR